MMAESGIVGGPIRSILGKDEGPLVRGPRAPR